MKKVLIPLILFFVSTANATQDKAALVDAVLKQSSIEISIMNMPAQLSQLPAMMPMEAQQKQVLMDDVVATIMNDFNEVEVFNAVKQHFVQQGDSDKLRLVLNWLNSPEGREITQVEILAQQIDPLAMQQYIMAFTPEALGRRKMALFSDLVAASEMNEMMFKMMEKFMPAMMKGVVEIDKALGQNRISDPVEFERTFRKQITMMRDQLGPMLEMQMVATFSYMFRDASDPSLEAYSQFLASEAGQHYMALSVDSILEYGVDWMEHMLTGMAKVIVANSVNE